MSAAPSNQDDDVSIRSMSTVVPSFHITLILASMYVLSGVTQPLLLEVAKSGGLTDQTCQIYMLAYYMGTASVILLARNEGRLSCSLTLKTALVASIDIVAQTMNYSGVTLAGPTIFALIYSSVTIWCALLSRLLLKREMSKLQWVAVAIVFIGLGITGLSSLEYGPDIARGTILIGLGSALHALMYVLSEMVMKNDNNRGKEEDVSAQMYCGVYGTVASSIFLLWQIFYTRQHFNELILEPMQSAGTTIGYALIILCGIALMSMVHSVTFFHTLKYLPGGSTSAGILKALQAVLVFGATSIAFCNKMGGEEMCFSYDKMMSLCVVVAGVILFGKATEMGGDRGVEKVKSSIADSKGYKRINSLKEVEMEATREYHQV